MKVFNDLRGYDPKIPHIAQFEYDMDRQGVTEHSKKHFEISGKREEARGTGSAENLRALRVKRMTEEEATKP